MTRAKPNGTVYLLHFDLPYRHARHYTGWTTDLNARLAEHRDGRGARLMSVIREAGIGFSLARTWEGTRGRERQLKQTGGASRRCPMCGVTPRHGVTRDHQPHATARDSSNRDEATRSAETGQDLDQGSSTSALAGYAGTGNALADAVARSTEREGMDR
ncbi:hypothetical protein [Nocardia sp. CC227C]|uniref:hypothetical protein n=1 Tax=Nocardia sp. CC227C TaxID=3044562 RepID=UPI00278BF8BB|nr:hypothetical protein [Nocardia sp. CC227C]